ncbi:amino acid ABC transporter permease [Gloeocapsa sp. PCC 73106]|uniref:amino acid ABC transporter permease n=1 Tax=Gloeocapsa sp. PCC 73106 TaxID=102232 RepID=UPI0002AD1583|nr:amino acid ABC transporter permease [Gloeocapsa sp. PCC 73106]ELR97733.1 amine acid ABC transporter, permease protein, 3-TM region, His/Glu/Gln/Arg/opine family [Gloeocapsa sp. PCC 73106]
MNWLKTNLFSTWYNTLLTIISLLFIYWLGSNLLIWMFTQAQWSVLQANFRLFFVGRYPVELLGRIWLALGVIIGVAGFSGGIFQIKLKNLILLGVICLLLVPLNSVKVLGLLVLLVISVKLGQILSKIIPNLTLGLPLIYLLSFSLIVWLLVGGFGLKPVKLESISGLILTILIASVSIFLSFPFGILLALGRQSNLPVIRYLSIGYIEIIRGLPLIGILFMAQVMLPLILPANTRPNPVLRAIAGFTIFSSAYLAENVRGGLQSIPKGQIEAAKALGFNSPLRLALIILPQALRAVIPSIVGQFISLFKDTSLLSIVGLVDLLGISQSILANPKFIGRYAEVYLFIAFIYFVFCYSMSLVSRQLETKQ